MGARSKRAALWIGIDVAKAMIDVARGPSGPVERVMRSREALAVWARTIPRHAHVVLEATGGFERLVTAALREQGSGRSSWVHTSGSVNATLHRPGGEPTRHG